MAYDQRLADVEAENERLRTQLVLKDLQIKADGHALEALALADCTLSPESASAVVRALKELHDGSIWHVDGTANGLVRCLVCGFQWCGEERHISCRVERAREALSRPDVAALAKS